jgi:Tol biopolymer transport system component
MMRRSGAITALAALAMLVGHADAVSAAATAVKNGSLTYDDYSYAPGAEGPAIFVQPPRGAGPTASWVDPGALYEHSPRYSPDGTEIAYVLVDVQDERWLVVRDANTGATVSTTPIAVDVQADGIDWSPDGTRVVVIDLHSLYVVDLATGATTMIFTRAGQVHDPAWSPDGTRIAFAQGTAIKLINPDGTGLRTFTSTSGGVNATPAWSPDSSTIAFVTSRFGDDELVTLPRSGNGTPTRVSHLAGQPPTRFFFTDVEWSPDGKKIAALEFENVDDLSWTRIRAYAADGAYKYWLTERLDADGVAGSIDWGPRLAP